MSGRPTAALLIHGFLDRSTAWADFARILEDAGLRVFSPDLAGAGGRAKDSGPFTLARATAEFVQIIDERPEEVFIVVGHSMGGQIADLVANERPDRVAALVLLTAVPLAGRDMPDDARQLLRSAGGNVHAQRQIRELFSVNLSPEQIDDLVAQPGLMDTDAAMDYYDAFTAGDPSGSIGPAFEGSVFIVAAAEDQVVTVDQALALRSERYPEADFLIVEKSGHWLHTEQPKATASAVLNFIAR